MNQSAKIQLIQAFETKNLDCKFLQRDFLILVEIILVVTQKIKERGEGREQQGTVLKECCQIQKKF